MTGPRGGWSWACESYYTPRVLYVWVRRNACHAFLAPVGVSSFRLIGQPEIGLRRSAARYRPDIALLISELDAAEDEAAVALLLQIVDASPIEQAPSVESLREVIDRVLSRE